MWFYGFLVYFYKVNVFYEKENLVLIFILVFVVYVYFFCVKIGRWFFFIGFFYNLNVREDMIFKLWVEFGDISISILVLFLI